MTLNNYLILVHGTRHRATHADVLATDTIIEMAENASASTNDTIFYLTTPEQLRENGWEDLADALAARYGDDTTVYTAYGITERDEYVPLPPDADPDDIWLSASIEWLRHDGDTAYVLTTADEAFEHAARLRERGEKLLAAEVEECASELDRHAQIDSLIRDAVRMRDELIRECADAVDARICWHPASNELFLCTRLHGGAGLNCVSITISSCMSRDDIRDIIRDAIASKEWCNDRS